jgi:hypothetical protein
MRTYLCAVEEQISNPINQEQAGQTRKADAWLLEEEDRDELGRDAWMLAGLATKKYLQMEEKSYIPSPNLWLVLYDACLQHISGASIQREKDPLC